MDHQDCLTIAVVFDDGMTFRTEASSFIRCGEQYGAWLLVEREKYVPDRQKYKKQEGDKKYFVFCSHKTKTTRLLPGRRKMRTITQRKRAVP
jgi:hypothetical protein